MLVDWKGLGWFGRCLSCCHLVLLFSCFCWCRFSHTKFMCVVFFSPLVLLDLFDALGCHLSGLAVPAISSISCCLPVMPNLPPVTAGIQTILVLVSWATAAGLAPGQMALALSLAEFCCLLLWMELLAGGICWFSFWLLLSFQCSLSRGRCFSFAWQVHDVGSWCSPICYARAVFSANLLINFEGWLTTAPTTL